MQLVTDDFKALAVSPSTSPRVRVGIAWDGTTVQWEESNLTQMSITSALADFSQGRLTPMGRIDTGRITFDNKDGRYSPFDDNAIDQDIHRYINDDDGVVGIPIHIDFSFDQRIGIPPLWTPTGEWCRFFTGYLYTDNYAPSKNQVTYTLRDNTWPALQQKVDSDLYVDMPIRDLLHEYANLSNLTYVDEFFSYTPYIIPAAWLEHDSVLNDMQDLTTSVGGWLFGDNAGYLHFETVDTWLQKSVSFAFTGDHFEALPFVRNPNDLASRVIIVNSPRYLTTEGVIYNLDEYRSIPPNAQISFTAKFALPAASVINENNLVAGTHYWFKNAGGLSMNDFCSINLDSQVQGSDITILNSHPTLSATLSFLELTGISIEGGPTGEVEKVNDDARTDRTRSITSNFYIQATSQAEFLAQLMIDRTKQMIPFFTAKTVPALPWLEISDKVTFLDGNNLPTPRTGFITNIQTTFNDESFEQDFIVTDAAPWYVEDDYFVIGVSELWVSDESSPNYGVTWY